MLIKDTGKSKLIGIIFVLILLGLICIKTDNLEFFFGGTFGVIIGVLAAKGVAFFCKERFSNFKKGKGFLLNKDLDMEREVKK